MIFLFALLWGTSLECKSNVAPYKKAAKLKVMDDKSVFSSKVRFNLPFGASFGIYDFEEFKTDQKYAAGLYLSWTYYDILQICLKGDDVLGRKGAIIGYKVDSKPENSYDGKGSLEMGGAVSVAAKLSLGSLLSFEPELAFRVNKGKFVRNEAASFILPGFRVKCPLKLDFCFLDDLHLILNISGSCHKSFANEIYYRSPLVDYKGSGWSFNSSICLDLSYTLLNILTFSLPMYGKYEGEYWKLSGEDESTFTVETALRASLDYNLAGGLDLLVNGTFICDILKICRSGNNKWEEEWFPKVGFSFDVGFRYNFI